MPDQQAPRRGEQLRGEALRRHVLLAAKDVFLEAGYDRASMDTVAARARTSKRSLYAHFGTKEDLFLAVLDLVRELYLGRLRTPDAYSAEPVEAVVIFCARFLQLTTWEPMVRTCRLSIAAAERLPGSSQAYFDAMFADTYARLASYLVDQWRLGPDEAALRAEDLCSRTVLPRLLRALLNVDEAGTREPEETTLAEDVDLDGVRRTVSAALPARGATAAAAP